MKLCLERRLQVYQFTSYSKSTVDNKAGPVFLLYQQLICPKKDPEVQFTAPRDHCVREDHLPICLGYWRMSLSFEFCARLQLTTQLNGGH
jgi:hypothetical protein